jgi:hypothetical protein
MRPGCRSADKDTKDITVIKQEQSGKGGTKWIGE